MQKKVHKHAEIIEEKTKDDKKEKVAVELKSTEITKVAHELKEEIKVEADGNVPYFVHYVYAPQLFSDENPNACSVM